MSKCIIIIGTPRSGTSCVGGIMHNLGINMGDELIPADDRWNPMGFFQDDVFEQILHESIGKWKFPPLTTSKNNNLKIKQYVKKRQKDQIWGLKSNRIIYFLKEFLDAAVDYKIIRTQRNITKSIQSWASITGDGDDSPYNPIRKVNSNINDAFEELKITPDLIVDYDAMIENPEITVQNIANVCGVPSTSESIKFINSSLRHF